ncbi:MAG: electron transport complex subunit RsxC [Actinobacteria bacterium]|nr:electron transport complex subunit RsxC [Actinomycetota bacterium]
MRKAFKGGIHPPEYKEISKDCQITVLEAPERVVLPLSQHVGNPAKPIVNPKDKVVKGQLVAEAQGFVSANIHSPVSGTVIAITKHPSASGIRVESLIIEREESDEEFRYEPLENPEPRSIVERVFQAGIVGLGGAAFPTHVKLSPPEEYPVDTVIINGAECEPYLTVDYRLMIENTDEIIAGALLVKEAVGARRVIIAIESNKEDAAKKIASISPSEIEVVLLPTKYPQGSEKHLIKAVLGREVPQQGLPFHVGVLVQNIQTVIAVKRAVQEGIPLYERVITVSGQAVNNPSNIKVPVGTLVSYIIDILGGLKEDAKKVILGGPMTGIALGRLDVPVTKGTSGIVALSSDIVSRYDESDTCIRCGRCVEVCPMFLQPYLLGTLGRLGRADALIENNVYDCIECGSCSFICPSKRNLVQLIRVGKSIAREVKK